MKTAENNKLRGNTKVERIISITYKRRRLPTAPFMSEDIVLEILVRLPVKDILRCRTVCKSWLAITKDLRFTCRHLQQSISKNNKYFLMVPQTLHSVIEEEIWPSTFSNNIPFYTCQEGHHTATLLFARDFSGDFGSVYRMSHRDGLVLVPTDTKVYVINPATRDVLVLPDGQRDTLVPDYNYPQAVGFGLDPRTKRYKVARFFYRAVNIDENFYSMGMEVLTICGDGNNASWRETLEDPPYPVLGYRVPAYFKGSLFWIIGSYTSQQSPKGFLRFHLEDETFSFIPLPASACGDEPLEIMGRGEQLYLAQCQPPHHLVIWMFCDTRSRQWRQLYSINISEPFKVHSTVMLHDGLYFHKGRNICRCDVNVVFSMDQLRYRRQMAGTFEDSNWTNVHSINWMPYMESLVPVTRARCDRATPTPRLLL